MSVQKVLGCTLALALAYAVSGGAARADVLLWIDDTTGNIGELDITTQSVVSGTVHNTGHTFTDIAFNSTGTLFATTATGLYSISTATGAATHIGSYSAGGSGMNALVGTGGTTLLAASTATDEVYTINPTNAHTTNFHASPAPSAGDLAFSGATLYESATSRSGDNELVDISSNSVVGAFHVGSASGPTLNSVFALADNGATMYGIAGTVVYTVDTSTAMLTPVFDYSLPQSALRTANGGAFLGKRDPVPEPASLALLGTACAGLGLLRRRRATR